MKENYFQQQIKRVSKNKMIILLIILIISVFFIAVADETISNAFGTGAEAVDYGQLKQHLKKGNVFVKSKDVSLADTGYYSHTDSETNTIYYYVFLVNEGQGQKYVFYTTKTDFSEQEIEHVTVTGRIRKFEDIDRQVCEQTTADLAAAWEVDHAEANSYLAQNLLIDGTVSRLGTQMKFAIAVLVGIICLIFIIKNLLIFLDYRKYKNYKKLLLNTNAESELYNETLAIDTKKFKISNTFIFMEESLWFDIRLKDDLIWAYHKQIRQKLYGIIPAGKSSSIVLHFKNSPKDVREVQVGNKKKTLEIIAELEKYLPGIMIGYSEELKSLHDNQFTDFLEMAKDYNQKHK